MIWVKLLIAGILDTDTFVWSRLRVSGTPPNPRYSHTANISGPDVVFFGGWTTTSGDRGYFLNFKRIEFYSLIRYWLFPSFEYRINGLGKR
jgi:hypothetical protein